MDLKAYLTLYKDSELRYTGSITIKTQKGKMTEKSRNIYRCLCDYFLPSSSPQ